MQDFCKSHLLKELLEDYSIAESEAEKHVTSICLDSRKVTPGALFFAINGQNEDGRDYIFEAFRKGAVAVVAEKDNFNYDVLSDKNISIIFVSDVRKRLAKVSSKFYNSSTDKLLTIGVTGTNGKTSVSWIITESLNLLCGTAAQVGTLGFRVLGERGGEKGGEAGGSNFLELNSISNTTPDPITLNYFFQELVKSDIKAVTLEVSSHGVTQARIDGINWDLGVLTNLTRDHLDFHGTFENYQQAKKKFLTEELEKSSKKEKFAVLNYSDSLGRELLDKKNSYFSNVLPLSYSSNVSCADAYITKSSGDLTKTEIEAVVLGEKLTLETKLIGSYNLENILAAVTSLKALGFSKDKICSAISVVPPVPGRLEVVGDDKSPIFIDYAHTPDGLISVQKSLRGLTKGRLVTVFGCGGDRDRGKRPEMGTAVANFSDYAILTSDNPRTENPEQIIKDIIPGMEKLDKSRYVVISNRKEAIQYAIKNRSEGDVVLIAGKGHETYQEINGVRYPFSDKEVCKDALGTS